MSGKRAYDPVLLEQWAARVLIHEGLSTADSDAVAHSLVEADLRGVRSHGLMGGQGLAEIRRGIQKGHIKRQPKPKRNLAGRGKYACVIIIDGDHQVGHAGARDAARLCQSLAGTYGIGKVYLHNTTHFGMAGLYSEQMAAGGDVMARVTCTSPPWSVPFVHGNEVGKGVKAIGSNPIAWSTPYPDGVVTIDMATTQRAASVALRAGRENGRQLGQGMGSVARIPRDYLLGPSGEEVVEPRDEQFVRQCSILPLGGREFGYKGFGLALSIAFDGVLGDPRQDSSDETGNGDQLVQVFEAWALDLCHPVKTAIERIGSVASQVLARGGKGTLMPGQIERQRAEYSLLHGIEYDRIEWEGLSDIGKSCGLPLD